MRLAICMDQAASLGISGAHQVPGSTLTVDRSAVLWFQPMPAGGVMCESSAARPSLSFRVTGSGASSASVTITALFYLGEFHLCTAGGSRGKRKKVVTCWLHCGASLFISLPLLDMAGWEGEAQAWSRLLLLLGSCLPACCHLHCWGPVGPCQPLGWGASGVVSTEYVHLAHLQCDVFSQGLSVFSVFFCSAKSRGHGQYPIKS